MIKITEVVFEDIEENEEYKILSEQVMQKCFEVEKINPTSLYVCVTFTTPQNIRKANKEYRNLDKETDVLSFPMYEKEELDELLASHKLEQWQEEVEEALQDVLGDIIISIERVRKQAKEYEHSFKRELAYMLVHGFYHLRGYDHMTEDEKKVMREKEENVLSTLEISR